MALKEILYILRPDDTQLTEKTFSKLPVNFMSNKSYKKHLNNTDFHNISDDFKISDYAGSFPFPLYTQSPHTTQNNDLYNIIFLKRRGMLWYVSKKQDPLPEATHVLSPCAFSASKVNL